MTAFVLFASLALAAADAAAVRGFGFVPPSFPRDTVRFDTFREQIAIGQVLEPLVSSDRFGNVAPALADRWEVREGGKTLRFHLRPGALFSNGAAVSPADVVATLERHWRSPRSESYSLLQNVAGIAALPGRVVEIRLRRPQVALLKILSRDHLGIMPAAWKYVEGAAEPYVGTGPYRLVKDGGAWWFEANPRSPDRKAAAVERWKLVFAPQDPRELSSSAEIPDYVPVLVKAELEALRRNPRFDASVYEVKPRFGFFQLSAWWNPRAAGYADAAARRRKMGAIRALFRRRREALKAQPAFGVIPIGVSGHLVAEVPFAPVERSSAPVVVKVSVPVRLKEEVFEPASVAAVEEELGVRFEVEVADGSPTADVLVDRWAGGFNDAEGSLPMIADLTRMPLKTYLAGLYPAYLAASTELDWTRRAELFRAFDRALVAEERVVPGWRAELYVLLKADLSGADADLRYAPKLLGLAPR